VIAVEDHGDMLEEQERFEVYWPSDEAGLYGKPLDVLDEVTFSLGEIMAHGSKRAPAVYVDGNIYENPELIDNSAAA
jgi:hypothetical protein